MRDAAGLTTSPTPLHGTRQHISRQVEVAAACCWARGGTKPDSRLQRLLFGRLFGDVGKHSLEYFASDSVRVFLRRHFRLAYSAFSGRYGVGGLNFLSNH